MINIIIIIIVIVIVIIITIIIIITITTTTIIIIIFVVAQVNMCYVIFYLDDLSYFALIFELTLLFSMSLMWSVYDAFFNARISD
jgi:hypothetical protein